MKLQARSRVGNQTLVNISHMERLAIASDSPIILIMKSTQDQVCKNTIKKSNISLGNCCPHDVKTNILSHVVRELLAFRYVESNRFPLATLIAKFCLVRKKLKSLKNDYIKTVKNGSHIVVNVIITH